MAGYRKQPGDEFSYSNSGYDLLGAVIERVSGQPYHDFFQSRVFDPLGMKDTFSIPDRRVRDPRCATGYTLGDWGDLIEHGPTEFDDLVGSGSFYTTVCDLCLYEQSLRTNRLVSEPVLRQVFTSGRTSDGHDTSYGFGWYVGTHKGMHLADHEGAWIGFHSYIRHYLDRPVGVFLLSNHPEVDLVEIADAAVATLC
jgi:CubicO group peptidase (beta-lactamase class C family)